MKEVIIIGAGGHSKVIAEIVKANNDMVVGYLDDNKKDNTILGRISDCVNYQDKYFIIGIGDNSARKAIAGMYGMLKWYTAIHPTAVVSESAVVGEGTVICPNAVINAEAVVGKHCVINTAAVAEHDNVIGDFCHISPRATLCGTVEVGECTQVGAGAVVKNNVKICGNVTIGIGAAVVKDIDGEGVYVGVPARRLKGELI